MDSISMKFRVISFYRYVNIENPEKLMDDIREFSNEREIVGRILIAKEGLNGAISGNSEKIEEFKEWILENPLFENLTFREQEIPKNVYHKLVVRVREEIVALGIDADLKNSGEHISPEKFNGLIESEDDLVILDARNDYEFKVGKFKGAEVLAIRSFREFSKEIDKLKDKKDKKIVMYCTGGVRCEKSSAFLKENGFKKVYQLEGGIINYINKFPNKHYEGGCYVFDDRLVHPVNDPVSNCKICDGETSKMINCHNLDCDKLTIMCLDCQTEMEKNCSKECKSAPMHREEKDILLLKNE